MTKIREILEKYKNSDLFYKVGTVEFIYEKDFDKLEKELQEYLDEMLLWAREDE